MKLISVISLRNALL